MPIITERIAPPTAQVEMPGGFWTPKEFVIFEGATTEQLCQSVKRLNKLNLSSKWALGDLGIALQERKRIEVAKQAADLLSYAATIDTNEPEAVARKRKLEKEAAELEKIKVPQYTSELAEKLGVDVGHWWNCVTLARAFKPSLRSEALLPEHYLVALKFAGGAKAVATEQGLKKARECIAIAEEGENGRVLPASKVRRWANTSLATHTPPKGKPEPDPYAELTAAAQWAIGYRSEVGKLSKDQAVRVFTLMRSLRELADALRERCEA